jgi:hypothetical protein
MSARTSLSRTSAVAMEAVLVVTTVETHSKLSLQRAHGTVCLLSPPSALSRLLATGRCEYCQYHTAQPELCYSGCGMLGILLRCLLHTRNLLSSMIMIGRYDEKLQDGMG